MRKKVFLILPLLLLFLVFAAAPSYGGQATLCWDPPTTNADGTPLTDLEGYNIYYGTSSGNYSVIEDMHLGECVSCGGSHPECDLCANACTYTVTNLSAGVTYWFVATAYDTSANESGYSNEVSKTIGTTQYALYVSKSGTGTGTVTSSPAGINCGSTCSADFNTGTVITLTAAPASGSTFSGWSGGGCSGTGTCSFTLNANTTVTAAFAIKTYTLTVTQTANGTVSPGTTAVNYGGSQTFTITPSTGYHIASVTVDGGSVGAVTSYTFSNVTATHTISATFAINTYTITSSAGSGGTISPSGTVTVNYGESQTFTITPNMGYYIAGVTVDGSSAGTVTSYTFSNVTATHTIAAIFTEGTSNSDDTDDDIILMIILGK